MPKLKKCDAPLNDVAGVFGQMPDERVRNDAAPAGEYQPAQARREPGPGRGTSRGRAPAAPAGLSVIGAREGDQAGRSRRDAAHADRGTRAGAIRW